MEVESSPLAAQMQSPAFRHTSAFLGDMTRGSPSKNLGGNLFGPKLNLAVKFETQDTYYEDSRMSSPTTSLVADLSQNFHIDKMPQIPTPRRSLFTSLAMNAGFRSTVTTPPIPTSSPVGNDSMDISPLPHKAPYSSFRSPRSPTKGQDMDMSLCSSPIAPSPSMRMDPPARRPILADRKRSAVGARPGMMKNARFSSNGVSFKSQGSAPTMTRALTAPQINLEELFGGSSPERTRKSSSPRSNMLAPPPPRPFSFSDMDGSPVAPSNRASRPCRPKGKIRRTLSMFQNAEEVTRMDSDDHEMGSPKLDLVSPSRLAAGEKHMLPSFNVRDDPLRRITVETMVDVLSGNYKEHYDELVIVDCRFAYEFEGGHIADAVNYNSIDVLEDEFNVQDGPRPEIEDKRRLIVFHCEFSAHRAPRMALHLRKRDRHINMHSYPGLSYPDVYILSGGYSAFWKKGDQSLCEPRAYIEMSDAAHTRTCEKEMGRFRRNTKFTRTQSFTYGVLSSSSSASADLDSSPSANLGSKRAGAPCKKDLGTPVGPSSLKQRRMASY